MKVLRPFSLRGSSALIAIALFGCFASPQAVAQWKWRDKNGQVTVSDVPPPKDVAQKDILQRPDPAAQRTIAAATPAPSASATQAPNALEAEVEARKRKTEQEQKAKEKAAEDHNAAARAENCNRAKTHLRALEDGLRMARVNDKGEREILDDKGRASEVQRARSIISSDCKV